MFAAVNDSGWHQAVGVNNHAKPRHRLLDRLQKPHVVRMIAINRLAFVASGRNMINGVERNRFAVGTCGNRFR